MIAESHEQLVGYALVHLAEGSHGHSTGALVGEVETLSVLLPKARGQGWGPLSWTRLSLGISEIRLGVVAGNDDAMRFYQRRGMGPFAEVLLGKVHQSGA